MECEEIHHPFNDGIPHVDIAHLIQPIQQNERAPHFQRLTQHGADGQIRADARKVLCNEIIQADVA